MYPKYAVMLLHRLLYIDRNVFNETQKEKKKANKFN